MTDRYNLHKIGNKPITSKELERLGIPRTAIQTLTKEEKLLRIGRGVYQLPSVELDNESLYRAATKRINGQSAVCLMSALSHYNLTDEIPKQTWLLVNIDSRSTHKDIRLYRSNNPHWKIGIVKADGYKITSLERTIVDAIILKKRFGTLGIQALKKALREKLTTASKIMDMATKFGADERVLPYLEALT
ncbi:MAG: type IV toxin-antitoxin system AbiEi family antitoxin domain-containing protein [Pseudobdellovibrionaceae bacterium]